MARLPYGRWSIDPPVDAASIAQSDVLATLIGVASANRVVTFADAVIAGLGFIASAVVKTVHLVDGSVTNAKLRDSAGVSVIGRSVNSTGSPADIVASSNNTVLKRKSNALVFAQVEAGDIATDAITTAKLESAQRLERVSDVTPNSTPVGAVTTATVKQVDVSGFPEVGDVLAHNHAKLFKTSRMFESDGKLSPPEDGDFSPYGKLPSGNYRIMGFIYGMTYRATNGDVVRFQQAVVQRVQ